ncbi:MAG: TIGR02452 family protein [Leptospiraceae bacterium]|nr:TIGR02452 family protein [Leptospiraceae bacterium]
MNEKLNNINVAKENSKIFKNYFYETKNGLRVDLKKQLDFSIHNTKQFDLEDNRSITQNYEFNHSAKYDLEITDENTIDAAKRIKNETKEKVIALNFASATNPGGGYLNGARAQEEFLCRQTTLYPTLLTQRDFYEFHRNKRSFLYSDKMIYSPNITVFRDSEFNLLVEPFNFSIISAAAPSLIGISPGDTNSFYQAEKTMSMRIFKLLETIRKLKYENIILGAWGCGAFKNNPYTIARLFKKHLYQNPDFQKSFSKVVFAIVDSKSEKNKFIFKEVFYNEVS